jgi:hypothetical protein
MRSDTRIPLLVALLLSLVLSACSADGAGTEPTAVLGTSDLAAAEDSSITPAGCPDDLEYPCTYDAIPDSILETQASYSTRMRQLIESDSRQAAHDWVSEQSGVVEAHIGDGFLSFRVEGGMPYMIATPLDEPVADGEQTTDALGSDQAEPEQMLVSLHPGAPTNDVFAEVVGRDTHRENPQNLKMALFLEPWGGSEGSLFGAGGRVEPEELLKAFDDYDHPDGVIHVLDGEVGPEWFTSDVWRHYDFIYVSTHSGTWEGGATIETGIRREWDLSPDQQLQFCDEMLAPFDGMVGVTCGEQYTPGKSFLTVDLDLAFFVNQFRDRGELLERAIVYIEGCESMAWPNLAKAIVAETSIYLGWSAGINLPKARESSGELLVQMTKRQRNVMQALNALCVNNRCGGERFKDPSNPRTDPPWLIPYAPEPEVHSLRLYDLPKFKDPKSPTSVLEEGAEIEINGKAGDEFDDELDITVDLIGVIDPDDTSGELTNTDHGSPADEYRVRFLLGSDEVEIGEDILGRHIQPGSSTERLLPLEENRWRYTYTADLGFDLDPDGMDTKLKVEVTLPEGGVSEFEVDVTLVDGGVGATISVGGESWEFELIDFGFGFGFCVQGVRTDMAGFVDGDYEGVGFSASVDAGGGEIYVDDPFSDQKWMAAADRAGMTDLHQVPEGSSQIDSIEVEDNVISGTATFIDTKAFRQFLHFDGPEPNPVPGSFEIRCQRTRASGDGGSGT